MALAIFDLDETLLSADSDHAWGEFLVQKGLVDKGEHRRKNDRFYAQYQAGELDIIAYLRYCCSLLARFPMSELEQYRAEFVASIVEPFIRPAALELLAMHRSQGDFPMVITSTNEFVARPIVDRIGIRTLIAPVPEVRDNRFTGNISGVPSFGEGKVTRLDEWLQETGETMTGSYFYTDSHNDLPLLRRVDNPVAVDPDDRLKQEARANHWPILSLR